MKYKQEKTFPCELGLWKRPASCPVFCAEVRQVDPWELDI